MWGLPTLDDQTRNSSGFTKEDNRKLQILVNNVLRSLTGSVREESTATLHSISNQLSVQQRCAFFSILQVHKTLLKGEPQYHQDQLVLRRTARQRAINQVDYRLSLSRGSFFYRRIKLYNTLPREITDIDKIISFKKALKSWVQHEISLVP